MKILKFGGTSVATAQRIIQVAHIIKQYYLQQNTPVGVVVSAMSGVTDQLIAMSQQAAQGNPQYLQTLHDYQQKHLQAAQVIEENKNPNTLTQHLLADFDELKEILHGVFLVRELTKRTLDFIISRGERNTAAMLTYVFNQQNTPAQYIDTRQYIITDNQFGSAKVDFDTTDKNLQNLFAQYPHDVLVITGFIGATPEGQTTTLGRGGSDYTAAIVGAAIHASVIEIWTDVDGVMTADPRKVKKAFSVQHMTYAEAMEMSHFGAKVIYPPTIQPALSKHIPIVIKNTFNPTHPGTYISTQHKPSPEIVKGITSISKVALLTLQGSGMIGVSGTAARLFTALASEKINIILITQGSSEQSISFAILPDDVQKAQQTVHKAFHLEIKAGYIDPLRIEENLSVVAIVGENMRARPGVAGIMFQALGQNGINLVAIAQGSSELNISAVIKSADESKALYALHEALFLSDIKVLHVFMVGIGLIGKTLLNQIAHQQNFLQTQRGIEIKIVALANSKQMLFNPDGIDLHTWEQTIQQTGEPMSPASFIARMKSLNLRNAIFIDNTANAEIPKIYPEILDSSISISTPNKLATSGTYAQYQLLKDTAHKRNVDFLYETNVGAGLPVISTLNDLITSGDRILKIEGVLSGTLSFIFNNFQVGMNFADLVRDAKAKGYTEPDPRDDLSGADVRRKLLILAREAGHQLETTDIIIEPILPQACLAAPSVNTFFDELERHKTYFDNLVQQAAARGEVLRYIATLDGTKAYLALRSVPSTHPLFGLSGSDNMIVFTTDRYKERPLVIRGPGAGAEVTAAGVFAEVIKIGSRRAHI
jgi:aspartokinase/homoserine dehydrogenase 1